MLLEELCAFGKDLLDANDLDPVYVLLANANLQPDRLRRFLLSYWCFYHVGVASELSKSDRWADLGKEVHTRASERRHFRGPKSIEALDWLKLHEEEWFKTLCACKTFDEVTAVAQCPPLFGPWVAFKIADMIERLELAEIDFADCELSLYKEPSRGAALVLFEDPDAYVSKSGIQHLVSAVVDRFTNLGYLAPPSADRVINIQEVETMLCKFKSHRNGHYPVGKDVAEIRHALEGWESDLIKWLP